MRRSSSRVIRSNTSMTGPTSTASPVSSSNSRVSAASSVSPISTIPPGRLQCPLSGSYLRRTRRTLPSSTITPPTPTMGRSGYSLGPFNSLIPHHLHDDALTPLSVELRVKHLLPRSEIEFPAGNWQHHLMPHDRSLQMRVRIVFAGLVVPVIQA